MVEKYPLHDIDSPLDREERLKVLENWHRITRYFNAVQGQIKILAGGEEIDEVLARIEEAITNAENATSDATTATGKITSALAQLDILISNTNASAQRAETAADDADQMNQILNNLKTELLALQTNLNGIVQAESQRVTNEGQRVSAEAGRRTEEITRRENEAARVLKEQARETAEQNRATAESAREAAEQTRQQKLAELLVVLDQLDFKGEYNPASNYLPFNVVRFGRASYVALQEVSGVQPSDDGVNWRLLAAGGIDGSGAVSTVNGIEPDELGNVQLIIDYINNLTSDRTDAGLSAAAGKVLKTLMDNHIGAGDNPHQVTAEQLALGNVQNFGVATQTDAEAGTANDKYMTPQRAKQAFDKNITTFSDSLEQLERQVTTHLDEDASEDNVHGLRERQIALGLNSLATGQYYATAIGDSAEATGARSTAIKGVASGNDSLAVGANATASAADTVALGKNSKAENSFEGVLGATGSSTRIWIVPGSFTVNGTKNFEIPHPKPEKSTTHRIRHGAVESPTTGDTLYRFKIVSTKENDLKFIDLPDYFIHLNKDVQVFVTPQGHFGNGYGLLNRETEQLEVHCQFKGEYNVLVIGTRNDDHQSVQEWDIKGVEREIGESWTGETFAFSVDEIMEVEEIKEELV